MIPTELLALAPSDLPNLRSHRFNGTGFEVSLSRFAPADTKLLGRLYQIVQDLASLRRRMGTVPSYGALRDYIRRVGNETLLADARRLGEATRGLGLQDAAVQKAIHDIRGGGLTTLLGTAELLDALPGNESLVRTCVDAARDHAKIMRNLLPDIDPETRAADEAAKAHGIAHFAEKWDGATVQGGNGVVTVRVRCEFGGDISARCLETSSIDRVVYNYVNNAVRFAAGGVVNLWIFPVGADLVRWVVQNRVTEDQTAFLTSAAPNLAQLYAGGITRGGSGVGLANCAEVIAGCFGLGDPSEAVERGYLGAAVREQNYHAWFHWPALSRDLTPVGAKVSGN